ncbi:MAG TPA: hypothetical protein VHM19_18625 [Polyangiales bacterium]|jgi:hypothetical protein|nr:hypothetical protein [Polyangiales bacterium]
MSTKHEEKMAELFQTREKLLAAKETLKQKQEALALVRAEVEVAAKEVGKLGTQYIELVNEVPQLLAADVNGILGPELKARREAIAAQEAAAKSKGATPRTGEARLDLAEAERVEEQRAAGDGSEQEPQAEATQEASAAQ